MKWSPLKVYTLKLTLFSTVLAYLAVDMWWWHGPIWQAMHTNQAANNVQQHVVAEVLGEYISEEQLARYEKEQRFLSGKESTDDLRRTSMLMDLVRAATLRIRTRYNDKNIPDYREAAEEEAARLAGRAQNTEQFEAWVQSQGYESVQDFTTQIEVRLRCLHQLERAIEPFCKVTDEDIKRHYELLKDSLIAPEQRTASHIFLETHNKDASEVQKKAQHILQRLQAGESFTDLARSCSEDTQSSARGGNLGVIANDARRPLPEIPLFGESALPAHTPQLVQSRWGWHILQLGEIQPLRPLSLQECRDSIESALISAQREIAIDTYFTTGVREGIRRKSIKIHAK